MGWMRREMMSKWKWIRVLLHNTLLISVCSTNVNRWSGDVTHCHRVRHTNTHFVFHTEKQSSNIKVVTFSWNTGKFKVHRILPALTFPVSPRIKKFMKRFSSNKVEVLAAWLFQPVTADITVHSPLSYSFSPPVFQSKDIGIQMHEELVKVTNELYTVSNLLTLPV